jgi:hypothetical protein
VDTRYTLIVELVKQLLTLATAVLTATVIFLKEVVGPDHLRSARVRRYLAWAWTNLFLSIVFGLLTLSALIGQVDVFVEARRPQAASSGSSASSSSSSGEAPKEPNVPSVYARNVRLFASLEWFCFATGIGFILPLGWAALPRRSAQASTGDSRGFVDRKGMADDAKQSPLPEQPWASPSSAVSTPLAPAAAPSGPRDAEPPTPTSEEPEPPTIDEGRPISPRGRS